MDQTKFRSIVHNWMLQKPSVIAEIIHRHFDDKKVNLTDHQNVIVESMRRVALLSVKEKIT